MIRLFFGGTRVCENEKRSNKKNEKRPKRRGREKRGRRQKRKQERAFFEEKKQKQPLLAPCCATTASDGSRRSQQRKNQPSLTFPRHFSLCLSTLSLSTCRSRFPRHRPFAPVARALDRETLFARSTKRKPHAHGFASLEPIAFSPLRLTRPLRRLRSFFFPTTKPTLHKR